MRWARFARPIFWLATLLRLVCDTVALRQTGRPCKLGTGQKYFAVHPGAGNSLEETCLGRSQFPYCCRGNLLMRTRPQLEWQIFKTS